MKTSVIDRLFVLSQTNWKKKILVECYLVVLVTEEQKGVYFSAIIAKMSFEVWKKEKKCHKHYSFQLLSILGSIAIYFATFENIEVFCQRVEIAQLVGLRQFS